MKQLNKYLTQLLLIISLMLPWATTVAQELITVLPGGSTKSTLTVETFDQAGAITKLGYDKFTVNGRDFRVAPRVLLDSKDSKRQKLSDFELGDIIYFKGRVLNDVNYVDIIYYEPPESS